MQGINWAFKKYKNQNLSKLVIEPENCRPPHILQMVKYEAKLDSTV